jgi:enhancing lycopene biosynthesis protein 2
MKVGVVLSGCGVYDGTEIHEAVLTLLALDRAGAEAVCFAPDMDQVDVVNHLTGQAMSGERRNVLVESARIARGKVRDLATAQASELDALIFPGGFGAAKNLCDFAVKGTECTLHPHVARMIREMHRARKPIGAICIAPAILSRALGDQGPRLTIGTDEKTAAALEQMGAKHQRCAVREVLVDEEHRIVTTPAYMLAARISEAAEGIEKLVGEILRLARR